MSATNHLFKAKVPLLNTALDAYSMRQRTIARNIANATSPNYRPERVKFEEEFARLQGVATQGERSDKRHIAIGPAKSDGVQPAVEDAPVPQPEILFSGDSHVNIDNEMANLAQNQIRHRFASRILSRYFKGLQGAIRGSNQ